MSRSVNVIQFVVVCCLVASCGGESKKASPGKASPKSTAKAPAMDGDAGAALQAASDKLRKLAHENARKDPNKQRKLTPTDRATFLRRLHEGRALQQQKKWLLSMAALDKALAVLPTSDRALSELSWSAFKAGDFKQAESAAKASVEHAVDPRVKAASLFNLGRALEKRADKAGAVVAYQRSLRLRPSTVVKKRLLSLGGKVPALVQTPPCARFQTTAQVCSCMRKAEPDLAVEKRPNEPDRFKGVCTPAGTVTGGLELLFVAVEDTARSRTFGTYLLTQVKGAKRAVIARVSAWVHQSYKHQDRAQLGKVETKTVAGRKVLQVELAKHVFVPDDYAQAWGINEGTNEDWLYYCVENDGFLKCPVQVPAFRLFTARLLDAASKDMFEDEFGPTTPYRRGIRMNVKLSKKGAVVVSHGSGEKAPDMMRHVGTKKLW